MTLIQQLTFSSATPICLTALMKNVSEGFPITWACNPVAYCRVKNTEVLFLGSLLLQLKCAIGIFPVNWVIPGKLVQDSPGLMV